MDAKTRPKPKGRPSMTRLIKHPSLLFRFYVNHEGWSPITKQRARIVEMARGGGVLNLLMISQMLDDIEHEVRVLRKEVEEASGAKINLVSPLTSLQGEST
jgi:dihydroorotate dehydrogenase